MGRVLNKKTGRTGGDVNKIDAIDGNDIGNGDFLFLFESGDIFTPYESSSPGGEEADPFLIKPDSNSGSKRWKLHFVKWLKEAINYTGDFIIREAGKGLILGDGEDDGTGFKLYKPTGNYPVRLLPISDSHGIAFRSAANNKDIAVFKDGAVTLKGLVEPSDDSDAVTKSFAEGTNSLSAAGYSILPGGLILQWGKKTMSQDTYTTVDFEIDFPTALLNLQVTPECSYDNNEFGGQISFTDPTLSSFQLNNGANRTITMNWFAVGK